MFTSPRMKEGKVEWEKGAERAMFFLFSLQPRTWVEKPPRGHRINQVAVSNHTNGPESIYHLY